MNYSYKKKYNKSYLVLEDFDSALYSEDYKDKMLKKNFIDGLLNMQVYSDNGIPSFYYDITSRQSLYSYFYDNKLSYEHIKLIFSSLNNTLLNLNKFLLDYNHLVLIPQCIFFSKDFKKVDFCYCTGMSNDFFITLKEFLNYLLTITDHNDDRAVLLAYSLQQESVKENYSFSSLLEIMDRQNSTVIQETPIIPDTEYLQQPEPEASGSYIETGPSNNILKESHVLNKDNYSYTSGFIIKNIIVFAIFAGSIITNLILGFMNLYSDELMFIILLSLIISAIFYTSKAVRLAPLYRIYTNPAQEDDEDIEQTPKPLVLRTIDSPDNSNETVLLCINPGPVVKHLIYTGIDFTSDSELTDFPFTIGKDSSNTLVINNPVISRQHARIIFENDNYFVEDLNSSNGTKLNDVSIEAYTPTILSSGDTLTFAHLTYIFQ